MKKENVFTFADGSLHFCEKYNIWLQHADERRKQL